MVIACGGRRRQSPAITGVTLTLGPALAGAALAAIVTHRQTTPGA
ncbi:hypothetical protein [Devosia sp.]|nr:hypothetical protein [Devosia sp.]